MALKVFIRVLLLATFIAFNLFAAQTSKTNTHVSTAKSTPLEWISLAPMPKVRQEIYPAVHNQQLVVAGGLSVINGTLVAQREVYAWQKQTNQWLELPSLPAERHHGFLVSAFADLYLFGGFDANSQGGWRASDQILTLQDNTWKQVATLPKPIAETNIAVLGRYIHITGGRTPKGTSNSTWQDHSDTDIHWRWEASSNSWQEMANLPTARNSACSVVVNNKWYVIGGRTVSGGNLATNERYDPNNDTWLTLAPMPQAQGGLACAAIGNDIYVMGGEFFNDGGGVYDEVWQYSTLSNTWAQLGNMPVSRHGHGLVNFEGDLFVVGGAEEVGAKGTLSSLAKAQVSQVPLSQKQRPQAESLHSSLLTLDAHLDTPLLFHRESYDFSAKGSFTQDRTSVDLPRLREGQLDGGFWVIYTPPGPLTSKEYQKARTSALLRQMSIREMAAKYAGHVELAFNADDAKRIHNAGKIVVFQNIEDVSFVPKITQALLEAGYSETDIAKIWSGNLLRLMREVEAAKSVKLSSPPIIR